MVDKAIANQYSRTNSRFHGTALNNSLPLPRALLICLLASSCSATAATVQIEALTDPTRKGSLSAVYIDGSIAPGLTERLVESLEAHRVQGGIVYFDSNGGDLRESLKLGEFLRQAGFDTGIGKRHTQSSSPAPASCESACILAFAGGKYRFAHDRSFIGIHRFYARTVGEQDLTLGQMVSAEIIAHLTSMGVSPSLFPRMVAAGSNMQKLPLGEAKSLGLVNNGIGQSSWYVHGVNDTLLLSGIQESWSGTGNIDMRCGRQGQVHLDAFFTTADFRAGDLAVHSVPMLRVDDRLISVEAHAGRAQRGFSTAQVSAVLNPPSITAMLGGRSIGFSWHDNDPAKTFGFDIPSAEHNQLIRSFLLNCTK